MISKNWKSGFEFASTLKGTDEGAVCTYDTMMSLVCWARV